MSFNIFPEGYDKVTSLQSNQFNEIHYFTNDLFINCELFNNFTNNHNNCIIYKFKTYKDAIEKIEKN